MSGPHAESGHEPEPVDYAEQIAEHYDRLRARAKVVYRNSPKEVLLATFRGLLAAGVISPGPAVTGRIEEAG
jgi:hypothetical protein